MYTCAYVLCVCRYSNIFVTSPSPENLRTLFEFVFRGFDSVGYSEHEHYDIIQSTNPEFNKAVVRVNVFSQHRQTIQVCDKLTSCAIFAVQGISIEVKHLSKKNNIYTYTHTGGILCSF